MLRANGVKSACKKLSVNVRFKDNLTLQKSSMEAGHLLAKEHFEEGGGVSAIFCATDALALGAMQAADERGLRIPEDISILGFDNISFTALPRIGISTVEQPKDDMARAAIDILIDRIEGRSEGFCFRSIKPRLVERTSCRRV